VLNLLSIDGLPLGHNARNSLALVAVRLSGATSILSLLATTGNIAGCLHELLPASLALLQFDRRTHFLVYEKLRAGYADTAENIENHREELDIVNRASKSVVAKVSRAVIIGLTARAALLAILQNAHTGIKETPNLGLITLISIIGSDFNHGPFLNLIRRENTELDTQNRFNFGRGRHL